MPDYAAAARLVDAARSITVVTHLRPDADAVGSACATVAALRQLGKEAVAVVGQRMAVAENLLTIPGAGELRLVDELPGDEDLVITVDCGSLDRTGTVADEIGADRERVLVIDHHASNPGFGAVDLIDDSAESTTTVLNRLFEELGVSVDHDIAHCLYAGLVTDTGSFRWGRPRMHTFAAELMGHGLDTRQIAVDLIDGTTPDDLRMIGDILSGLRVERTPTCSVAVLVADRERTAGHSDAAVESLVDFVRALHGTDLGVVLKETWPQRWAVSLRSTVMDVSAVAVSLGGGGHVPAAGYTTSGPAEDAVRELLGALGSQR